MRSEKQRLHLEKLANIRRGTKFSLEHRKRISLSRKLCIGENSSNWKGGKMVVGGYMYIYSPNHPNKTKDKYIFEQRLVMEKHLGRYLYKSEIVHHINGIKLDNRLCNLVVCSNRSIHNKYHQRKRDNRGRFC